MQTFRTIMPAQQAPFSLSYKHQTLSLGSCFAVHIGQRLQKNKFSILNNPFGVLYNPISMLKSLERLRSGQLYQSQDLFEQHNLWHNFDYHGAFSHFKQDMALQAMNDALQQGQKQLNNCQRIILTFGTAYVFEHIDQQRIVANCHKVPATYFRRYRLNIKDITPPWIKLLQSLKAANPDLKVILSVSPIRHLRDGLVENQRSKATLILAMEEICRQFDFVHYFPAYELLLDDLRDYRFYDRDLSHPNGFAIDYIWNYFRQTYFDESTTQIFQQVNKILISSEHRPLHPGSPAHRQFSIQLRKKIEALQKKYPFLDLD